MQDTVASRLKRLRKESHLSQEKLAEKAGVGQSAIGNIEAGVRGYGSSVVRVAAALGTNPDYLMLDSDDPAPNAQAAPSTAISYEAERFGRWLYKIKDTDLRERTFDAAMQVVYRAIDGQSGVLPLAPTPRLAAPNRKPRGEPLDH
jgi:transcriptional regulator with XRE-family HTH domain